MPKPTENKLPTIIVLGLLTGTLDALAAMIISYPATPAQIFKYIASGLFGREAFTGNSMILWGVLFHYLLATLFSAAFFELHPKFKNLTRNKYILGVIYGLMIWVTMNLAVLPLTNIPKQPEHTHIEWGGIFKGIAALIICLGIPISILSDRYYHKKLHRRSRRRRSSGRNPQS